MLEYQDGSKHLGEKKLNQWKINQLFKTSQKEDIKIIINGL